MSKFGGMRTAWRCTAMALFCIGTAQAAGKLNDTGQQQCLKLGAVSFDCVGTRQDAEYGRDTVFEPFYDGKGGFSFVKIAADGTELSVLDEQWSCVRDKHTGLMWEAKTNDGGLHQFDRTFMNTGNDGANTLIDFVATVNAAGLCGYHDWRVPTRQELLSIVDYGAETGEPVDTWWFVHNSPTWWSVDRFQRGPTSAWYVYRGETRFVAGSNSIAARLVRTVPAAASGNATEAVRFVVDGDKVKDKRTGLTWKRCSEGQAWNGSTCTGLPRDYTWLEAVALASSGAANAWRLPNIKELASISDDKLQPGGGCSGGWWPAIDATTFPNTVCRAYWASTFNAQNTGAGWYVNFAPNGEIVGSFGRGGRLPVRLVTGKP